MSLEIRTVTHSCTLMLNFGQSIFDTVIQARVRGPAIRDAADVEFVVEMCSEQMPAITDVNRFRFLAAFDW